MPTLHLPAAHTDTDVALATEVAHVVGSHELYVTWTHGEGPGLPPEVETLTPDEARASAISPVRRGRRRDGPGPSRRSGTRSCARRARALSCRAPRDDAAHPRSADAEPQALARPRRGQAPECLFARPPRARPLRTVPRAAASARLRLVALGRLGALAGPRLVELDAPLAVLGLHQRELRAEGAAGAALEAGDRPSRCGPWRSARGRPRAAASCRPCSSRSRSRSPGPRATSRRSPCGSRRCRGRRPGTGRGWPAGSGLP